jgi:hypothetical protein
MYTSAVDRRKDESRRFHGDALVRFFKLKPFRIFQLWLAAHQLDLISANPDKVQAAIACEAQYKVSAAAKKFSRLQLSAGIEACALTSLLSLVLRKAEPNAQRRPAIHAGI